MDYVVQSRNGPVEFSTELTVDQAAKILKAQTKPNNFRDSLLVSHDGRRGLSEKQELWFLKLAQDVLDEAKQEQVDGPYKSLVKVFSASGLSRLKIRFGDLSVSMAKPGSANEGWLYTHWCDAYAGKISPQGHDHLFWPNSHVREALDEVAKDPIGAAIKHGRETDSCACCGRGLSDPISVFAGIGPTCLERIAGKAARKEMQAAYKTNDNEGYLEVLRRLQFVEQQESRAAQPQEAKVEVKREGYSSDHDFMLARALEAL